MNSANRKSALLGPLRGNLPCARDERGTSTHCFVIGTNHGNPISACDFHSCFLLLIDGVALNGTECRGSAQTKSSIDSNAGSMCQGAGGEGPNGVKIGQITENLNKNMMSLKKHPGFINERGRPEARWSEETKMRRRS